MVARLFLSILAPLAVATAAIFASAPTGAADPNCSHYAWPNYPAECLTSENGIVAMKIGRKITPGSSDAHGIEARIVVAREPGVAPIASSSNRAEPMADLVELSGVATAFDPFATRAHAQPAMIDLQLTASGPESGASAELPNGYVEVTVWRGKRPTTYRVRSNP